MVTTDVNWGAVVVWSMPCQRFASLRTKRTSRAFMKPRSELVYTIGVELQATDR